MLLIDSARSFDDGIDFKMEYRQITSASFDAAGISSRADFDASSNEMAQRSQVKFSRFSGPGRWSQFENHFKFFESTADTAEDFSLLINPPGIEVVLEH